MRQQLGCRHAGRRLHGQPERADERFGANRELGRRALQRGREMRGEHEPDRDRLAVLQRMAGRGLQRVPERVPVVEHRARTGAFELVGFDAARLQRGTARDHLGERRRIARDQRVDARRHEVVAHQRVLRDLAESAAVVTVGQRREHARIREHADRLVERADEVLALGQVHAGLAADRAVDHRQQRGGHLHDVDPPVVHRGREAGGVADDAAAHRHHDVAPQQPEPRQVPGERLDGRERLGVLALPIVNVACAIPASSSARRRARRRGRRPPSR